MRISAPITGYLTNALHDLVARHGRFVTGIQNIMKSSNQVINNSAVLANDNDFAFSVGVSDVVTLMLILILGTGANAGWKFAFTVPAGANIYGVVTDDIGPIAAGNLTGWTDLATGKSYASVAAVNWTALILANYMSGGTSGIVRFKWAQQSAQAVNTTLYKQSSMLIMSQSA